MEEKTKKHGTEGGISEEFKDDRTTPTPEMEVKRLFTDMQFLIKELYQIDRDKADRMAAYYIAFIKLSPLPMVKISQYADALVERGKTRKKKPNFRDATDYLVEVGILARIIPTKLDLEGVVYHNCCKFVGALYPEPFTSRP